MSTRADYRKELRRKLNDWPKTDLLTGAHNATVTTLAVDTPALFQKGGIIKIDTEEMLVTNVAATITVARAWSGTTAATHVDDSVISIFQFFADSELNDYIANAIGDLWPDVFGRAMSVTLTLVSGTYSYNVPDAITTLAGVIVDIGYYTASDARDTKIPFEIWGGKIYITGDYSGTARISYIYPYAKPTDEATDLAVPATANRLIIDEAFIQAMENMMLDRNKFERYTTAVWKESTAGYEIESNLDSMRASAALLRDKLRMGLPTFIRRA